MYFGVEMFIGMIVYFVVASIIAIFSPFGIGFIIFSIVRIKTESEVIRKVSFVFQIVICALTLLGGILVSILLSFGNRYYGSGSNFYLPSFEQLLPGICVFFGVSFIVLIQLIIIIWEGHWIKNNNPSVKKSVYKR